MIIQQINNLSQPSFQLIKHINIIEFWRYVYNNQIFSRVMNNNQHQNVIHLSALTLPQINALSKQQVARMIHQSEMMSQTQLEKCQSNITHLRQRAELLKDQQPNKQNQAVVHELQSTINSQQVQIASLQDKINQQAADIAAHVNTINQRDITINRQKAIIDNHVNTINQWDQTINQREALIANNLNIINQMQQIITSQENIIKEYNQYRNCWRCFLAHRDRLVTLVCATIIYTLYFATTWAEATQTEEQVASRNSRLKYYTVTGIIIVAFFVVWGVLNCVRRQHPHN